MSKGILLGVCGGAAAGVLLAHRFALRQEAFDPRNKAANERAQIRAAATAKVAAHMQNVTDPGHSFDHVVKVTAHVERALECDFSLDERHKLILFLASLLHEVDDHKLFKSEGDANARIILGDVLPSSLGVEKVRIADAVVDVVNLVGTVKQKSSRVPAGEEWKLIVRDADRLEAVGEVGVARCYSYNRSLLGTAKERPLFAESTPRCRTEEEVWRVATPERFQAYDGDSNSMIDHYYDKLLHLDKAGSGNQYIEDQLKSRLQVMMRFVLDFGVKGTVDETELARLKAKHCPK